MQRVSPYFPLHLASCVLDSRSRRHCYVRKPLKEVTLWGPKGLPMAEAMQVSARATAGGKGMSCDKCFGQHVQQIKSDLVETPQQEWLQVPDKLQFNRLGI